MALRPLNSEEHIISAYLNICNRISQLKTVPQVDYVSTGSTHAATSHAIELLLFFVPYGSFLSD